MKKKLFALLLVTLLMLALTATAFAEGAEVVFNDKLEMESHFDDAFADVEPGDGATFSVTVRNTSGKTVDWYMLNNIEKSMEGSVAKNGAYTYSLYYQDSSGKLIELYDNDQVGGGGVDAAGEDHTNPTEEGLKEIKDALKDYMFLERMESGKSGVLTLTVVPEGETFDNPYQLALAELQLRFAVEVVPVNEVVVRTGDEPVNLSPMYIGMGVSGVALLLLAIDGAVRSARKRKEPNA